METFDRTLQQLELAEDWAAILHRLRQSHVSDRDLSASQLRLLRKAEKALDTVRQKKGREAAAAKHRQKRQAPLQAIRSNGKSRSWLDSSTVGDCSLPTPGDRWRARLHDGAGGGGGRQGSVSRGPKVVETETPSPPANSVEMAGRP